MTTLLTLLAIALGMLLTAQAGINSQLRAALGHPVVAATVSFVVGTLGLLVAAVALRVPWPTLRQAGAVPAWGWSGGLLGAVYIAASVVLAPRLGAAVLIASIVAGQLAAALVLDHFGLLGFAKQTVTPTRLTGALLLFAGVYLIQRK
ncbi:MAG: DMT family transporter [Gemmatimonas sp.]